MAVLLSILRKIKVLSLNKYFYLLLLLVCLFVFGYALQKFGVSSRYQKTEMHLGTVCNVQIVTSNKQKAEEAFKDCFLELERIEKTYSVFKEDSQIYILNNRKNPTLTKVSEELYFLIKKACEVSKNTNGAFDISVYSLILLWKDAVKKGKIPSDEEIQKTLQIVGSEKIQLLADNTVFMPLGMKIDLGGIAKLYAIDRLCKILYNKGIKNFLVNLGGDLYAAGKDENGNNWKIGLANPFKGKDEPIESFDVSNKAVITSGDYERFFEVNGKKYSHILNPLTGYPVEGSSSVTIFADSVKYGVSLAASVLGKEKGLKFLKSQQDIGYIVIFKNPDGTFFTESSRGSPK